MLRDKDNAAMDSSNRFPIIYPSHINLFMQCPERYYHERVERRRLEQAFNPALAKGIAMHEILATSALAYQKSSKINGGAAVPCDLVAQAESALPRAAYNSELAWRADTEAVLGAVKVGLSYLDGQARVLATEATYQFPYLRGQDCPKFTLAAKVDLVMLKQDSTGQPYLDVVDYKGGASLRPDPMQELAARIVVKQNADRFRVTYDYIQSTTIFLGAGVTSSQVIEAAECGKRWTQLKQVVSAIAGSKSWEPNPSPLCEWCPFFGDGCSLTPNAVDTESLGAWLDGVAV